MILKEGLYALFFYIPMFSGLLPCMRGYFIIDGVYVMGKHDDEGHRGDFITEWLEMAVINSLSLKP